LSSRNLRISEEKKQNSLGIYKSLQFIKNNFKEISFEKLIIEAKQMLLDEGFIKVDYISICNTDDLTIETSFEENKSYVCLIAAFLDDIRLIDNLILTD
jgi:pantoate--beta-alanine ligase